MTLHDIATQLYNSSVGGYINGEKFTQKKLEAALRCWMRHPENNKIRNTHVLEISLPDGRWLMTVDKFADNANGYDYYIPDTREQEARIKSLLTA